MITSVVMYWQMVVVAGDGISRRESSFSAWFRIIWPCPQMRYNYTFALLDSLQFESFLQFYRLRISLCPTALSVPWWGNYSTTLLHLSIIPYKVGSCNLLFLLSLDPSPNVGNAYWTYFLGLNPLVSMPGCIRWFPSPLDPLFM